MPNRSGRRFPTIGPSDLREVASSAQVDRVWNRLEASLDEKPTQRSLRSGWSWGITMAAVTFASGIWIGRQSADPVSLSDAQLSAEPPRAAGSPHSAPLVVRPAREAEAEPVVPKAIAPRSRRRVRGPVLPTATSGPDASDLLSPELVGPELVSPELVPAVPEQAAAPPKWQLLANSGEYEAAAFELEQAGGFEEVLAVSSPEQLMLLQDVARATGQRQRAVTALRRVIAEFPSDPVAPLAAWSLGNLLDGAGDKRGANEAYVAYGALSPEGDFAEDALVRQLRSAVQRRDRAKVAELSAQYERDFPEGGRRDEVDRWVAVLQATDVAEDADAGAPGDALGALDDLESDPRRGEAPSPAP
jgi:hypothetical protein